MPEPKSPPASIDVPNDLLALALLLRGDGATLSRTWDDLTVALRDADATLVAIQTAGAEGEEFDPGLVIHEIAKRLLPPDENNHDAHLINEAATDGVMLGMALAHRFLSGAGRLEAPKRTPRLHIGRRYVQGGAR